MKKKRDYVIMILFCTAIIFVPFLIKKHNLSRGSILVKAKILGTVKCGKMRICNKYSYKYKGKLYQGTAPIKKGQTTGSIINIEVSTKNPKKSYPR